MTDKLKQAILERAKDGRIGCREARALADALGVAYAQVGAAADALGVRIVNCELGCF